MVQEQNERAVALLSATKQAVEESEGVGAKASSPSARSATAHLPYATVYHLFLHFEPVLPEGEQFDIKEFPNEPCVQDVLQLQALLQQMHVLDSHSKQPPRHFFGSRNTLAVVVIEGAVEYSSNTGKAYRAIRVNELSREVTARLGYGTTKWVKGWNRTRKVKGKSEARLRSHVEVKKIRTIGTFSRQSQQFARPLPDILLWPEV